MSKLYLASQSPRRRMLLAQHGLEHEVVASGIDDAELAHGAVDPAQWVAALAYLKAASAWKRRPGRSCAGSGAEPRPGEAVILGADTVVVKDGAVVGQARDEADAERIVRLLENGEHEVLTGVALIDAATGERELFTERAQVRVGEIGDERVRAYAASGQWRGKAGAYNLAERLADGWPITFEGDPTSIMGLPMGALPGRLRAFVGRVRTGNGVEVSRCQGVEGAADRCCS